MAILLSDYLRQGAARPFAWGQSDCCLWVCDWIVRRRGVDPAASLRGRYATAAGAARHIRRAGGLEALVRREFAAAGLAETSDPLPGDAGLVGTGDGPALALWSGLHWVGKTAGGIVGAPFACIVAWTV